MKFSDYILIDAINPEIKATDKEGVIRELAQPLLDAGGIEKEYHDRRTRPVCSSVVMAYCG